MNYSRRSQCAGLMHNVRMYSIGHIMACVHVDTRFLDAKYTYHQNNGRGSMSTPRSQPGVRPAQGTHPLQSLPSVITRQLLIRSALVCTRPPFHHVFSARPLCVPPHFLGPRCIMWLHLKLSECWLVLACVAYRMERGEDEVPTSFLSNSVTNAKINISRSHSIKCIARLPHAPGDQNARVCERYRRNTRGGDGSKKGAFLKSVPNDGVGAGRSAGT